MSFEVSKAVVREAARAAARDVANGRARSIAAARRVEELIGPAFENLYRRERREVRDLLSALGGLRSDDPVALPVSTLGPAGRGRDEVSNTKTLGYLLDSKAGHPVAGPLCRALVHLIVRQSGASTRRWMRAIPVRDIADVSAVTERWVRISRSKKDKPRRIDIDVTVGRRHILIEGKIGASVRREQLADYERLPQDVRTYKGAQLVLLVAADGAELEADAHRWLRITWMQVAAAVAEATDGFVEEPTARFARLWASGVLREICHVPHMRALRPLRSSPSLRLLVEYLRCRRDLRS